MRSGLVARGRIENKTVFFFPISFYFKKLTVIGEKGLRRKTKLITQKRGKNS